MVDVIVYSTPNCPWCARVKGYLTDKGIPFTNYDVSVDMDKALEMIEKSKQRGVPVVDIDGNIIIGFDKAKIDELLGL